MYRILPLLAFTLAACVDTTGPSAPTKAPTTTSPPRQTSSTAAKNFISVVKRVEPVAERECRQRAPSLNCDFQIVVDDRPNQPSNAFQTVDRNGRPILAFTLALIADARNQDEIAFIMGHEAAHHIQGHLPKTQQRAVAGALIFGALASLGGAGQAGVQAAQEVGATVGSRTYSKEFELEADGLGTRIAHKAGYNPVRGAAFFTRIPDPGDQFLGTHPPNASRVETVRQTASQL